MRHNVLVVFFFFFSSRRRHTRCSRDWSSDVCSSDLCEICSSDASNDSYDFVPRWFVAVLQEIGLNQFANRIFARKKLTGKLLIYDSDSLRDRKSTRLNSSHGYISYAVFCLKKKSHRRRRPSRASLSRPNFSSLRTT